MYIKVNNVEFWQIILIVESVSSMLNHDRLLTKLATQKTQEAKSWKLNSIHRDLISMNLVLKLIIFALYEWSVLEFLWPYKSVDRELGSREYIICRFL